MKTDGNESRTTLVVQLLKSIALLLLYSAIAVALSIFLYGQWQAVTGVSWPLFLVFEAVVIVAAYKIGIFPAARLFFRRRSTK